MWHLLQRSIFIGSIPDPRTMDHIQAIGGDFLCHAAIRLNGQRVVLLKGVFLSKMVLATLPHGSQYSPRPSAQKPMLMIKYLLPLELVMCASGRAAHRAVTCIYLTNLVTVSLGTVLCMLSGAVGNAEQRWTRVGRQQFLFLN